MAHDRDRPTVENAVDIEVRVDTASKIENQRELHPIEHTEVPHGIS